MKQLIGHIGIIAAGLFLCLVLPGLRYLPAAGTADAVSSASMVVPDQPTGEFVVVLNRERHAATLDQWSDFFLEQPVDVIMEDVSCATVSGDPTGLQLAQRYQARLAENQMQLTGENGTLVVSKAEHGIFDAIILSKEAADAYDYSAVFARPDALVLIVEGGA